MNKLQILKSAKEVLNIESKAINDFKALELMLGFQVSDKKHTTFIL